MKNVGIWLDKEKAHIITLFQGEEKFETLFSELEFFNPKGGSRSKTRWGPQDVVQDSKYMEREKHQLKNYFQDLAMSIADAEAIAIFGPGDTNEKFRESLIKNHKGIASKVQTVSKVDSMTDNQVKALVRDYFKQKR
ncbi:hypothetical protein [Spongiimicrobium sp. 3-5]|uniref:hypothetical protein n=1 Tax=Spongiimicrobium sp. 3-5 TaxID=3332596 RepID=UPI0039817AEC